MQTILTRFSVLFLLVCCSAAALAARSEPEQLIRGVTDRILTRLDASPGMVKDKAELAQLIKTDVFPLVDFTSAARLTLGPYWARASTAQRKRFVSELRDLLACTYSAAFSHYSGQKVQWLPPRWSSARNYVEIRVRILQGGGSPLPVGYRLWKNNGSWKLYDLVVDGASLVQVYRDTFNERLRHEDFNALLREIAVQNARSCGNHA
jgi:phospholipid transport system substrate-binding protein